MFDRTSLPPRRLFPLFAAFALGCGGSSPAPAPPAEVPAGCNPLVGDDCLTPYPSAFFEVAEPSSPTGVRVRVPDGKLPVSASGVPIVVASTNRRDGFSPAAPILVYFKAGVDRASLPGSQAIDRSVTAASAVQILDYATGARVPLMAELDANAEAGTGFRQALIIRPMIRLKTSTRYVVALVGLKDAAGQPLAPVPFVALRDKGALSPSLMAVAAREEEVFAALEKAGVPRASLSLAWDFVTSSDQAATGHLVQMVDEALALADAGKLGFKISDVKDSPGDPHLLRKITGTFQAPSYLESDAVDAGMRLDGNGRPAVRGMTDVRFVAQIPKCAKAAQRPLPVFVFGHGIFGSAEGELGSDYLKQFGDEACMVGIGTDWIGLSSVDVATITNKILPDMNRFTIVTDRLQQGHVNAQVLARLFLTTIRKDAALALDGKAVTDGTEAYYYGISNGGVQGGTFMALSRDITRGALNVPGGDWSLLMFRSANFAALKIVLDSVYPDALDQQLLIAWTQQEWDYSDPVSFAPHLLADPLPKSMPKRILYQESIGDAQVPNLATRLMARTIGLPGMQLEQKVFGVEERAAPLDSAYTQWDVKPQPLPADVDVPPRGNEAHQAIRLLPDVNRQIRAFLKPDGVVTKVCADLCVYP